MTQVRRAGSVITLREEAIEEYERYHSAVWSDVLAALTRAHIRNYSIYRYGTLLFSYWEYDGEDYARDLAWLDTDPVSIEWVRIMQTFQVSVPEARPGQWLELPEVFHLD
ncbi:L-rhamnose mutarotase [Microbacterium sp. NPDC090007]|uniref:L-rhamnose mutarotase n=1 Tax=Microbacterium sp. NPDC090007 TaxID=3364204 RepID=UPI003804021A